MPESDSSGRIKSIRFADIIDLGRNKCGICGRAGEPDEIFANPGIYDEFVGSTYFCKDCCIELGMFFDAVPVEWHQTVVDDNDLLMRTNIELRSSVAKLEAIVDSLTVERLISRGIIADGTYVAANMAPTETPEQFVQPATADDPGPAQLKPDFVEPSTVSGPNDANEPASSDPIADLLGSVQ